MPGASCAYVKADKVLFAGTFFAFLFFHLYLPLVSGGSVSGRYLDIALAALLLAVSVLLALSMKTAEIALSKGEAVLFSGISLYLLYGGFISFSGLNLASSARTIIELITYCTFLVIVFLASRIIIALDLKFTMVKVLCLALGISLMTAYIMHFDNFAFLGSIANLFRAAGRYRFAFGFPHVNSAGKFALYFLAYSFMYRALAEERNTPGTWFSRIFLVPVSAVAVIILLSTGSRASITSLILFILAYLSLTCYSKLGVIPRIITVITAIALAVFIAGLIDWQYIFVESNRESNYVALFVVDAKNAWLTGLSFSNSTDLSSIGNIIWLDSFYLYIFLQSGLIGFVIFFSAIFRFAAAYFRKSAQMTKFQRLTGALLAV